MGTLRQTIEIGVEQTGRFVEVDALVDTGATYTSVPRDILESLGVEPQEERAFILANGERATLGLAWVQCRIDGREDPTPVVFGAPVSQALLGAFTLEGFGLGVDSVNRRLIETPAFLLAAELDRGE
jgi:aspartyl protease family protein